MVNKEELGRLSENAKIDCINKFSQILEKAFKENNCSKFIINRNMKLNGKNVSVHYLHLSANGIDVAYQNGNDVKEIPMIKLSFAEVCCLIDSAMRMFDEVGKSKYVQISLPGYVDVEVPYDYCGNVIEVRNWLYDHFGEVMEKNKDELFHSVNSLYVSRIR